jgi:hypothetical protein
MAQVLTGALAIIKKNGTVIGRMRNIRVNENTNLGEVRGIGTIFTIEAPALAHGGTWSCDFYEIDFTKTGIPGAIRRDVQTNEEFEDQLLGNEDGFQIDIFRRVKDAVDPNTGKIKLKAIPHACLKRCFLDSEGLDISEGAISGHSQSGKYLDPIIRPA